MTPLTEFQSSPQRAPAYALHRDAVSAVDVIANVPRSYGCNAAMYKNCHIQVLPSGGANPSVEVYWWSEKAQVWVANNAAVAKAGAGANVPYEFTIQPMGRIFFVAFTALGAGQADVLVSGFEEEQFS